MSYATRLAATLALLLLTGLGCRRQSTPSTPSTASDTSVAPSDPQLTSQVQAKLQQESALAGENIQVAASNGVVTLTGSASNSASRALAGNDAGQVSGVKTVVNNLEVTPPQVASANTPAPAPERRHSDRRRHERAARHDVPPPPQPAPQPPALAQNTPPPPPPQPAAPPPPPQPVVRTFTFPAGTVIPVRVDDNLSSANAQVNQSFHASLAADLVRDGHVVVPQGTPVLGRVADAQDAAHFSGSALLSLELTRIDLRDRHLSIVTDTWAQRGAGRGKNTAKKAAGGAILGTVIGALAGGGKGAAIGAAAGAGAGTGINAATRGQQVEVPSETLVNFTLQSPLSVTITLRPPGSPSQNQQPQPSLEQRPQPQ
ncbi:MAG TPA: BON domain-containing protein [Acidobacteriaceae bacterium]